MVFLNQLKINIINNTRSDQHIVSGSACVNEGHLSLDGSIHPKVHALKPDLILRNDQLEYGVAENGFVDESSVGEKELHETFMNLPKTLKDIMLKLIAKVEHDEESVRLLRVVGMVHAYLHMKTYVMDVPDGYMCCIREIKQQQSPETLIDFYKTYIPYLEAVLKIKWIHNFRS
ncbi:hypothetical protein BDB00DRAFT_784606 [Zychaea mexicana]|uniref:uncharacterized protein n=1 Tax=Zychaea mexicana TaxID=64656 RepID=UPI0022FF13B7|nr:uncharacterized protein BDB00DRAFT_784606 [Zychaea mexicana]KAI9497685.1 hypothetical protein BDB00DRAFT_784606 [Zychaea mexicana]